MKCISENCNKNSGREKGHWFNDGQDDYWICEQCEVEYQKFKAKSKVNFQIKQEQEEENLTYGIEESFWD